MYRLSVSFYTTANIYLLGIFSAPAIVAMYAVSEKVIKSILALQRPFTQAIYPRVSYLFHKEQSEAERVSKEVLIIVTAFSIICALVTALLSEYIVSILFGNKYLEAGKYLRYMTLYIPLIMISNVLGIQYMLPLGKDRIFNTIIITAGMINLALVFLLVPEYSVMGMIASIAITESFVVFSMYTYVRKKIFQSSNAK